MNNVTFEVIKYGEDRHYEAIALRKNVLYKAREISATDYCEAENHIQIGGFKDNAMIATCALVPEGEDCRMRYVAVKTEAQSSGVGTKMLEFFEQLARSRKFKSIYCHARDSATNFYHKNGYQTEGAFFEQVTITHIKMRKIL